jgi:hypothetical protein
MILANMIQIPVAFSKATENGNIGNIGIETRHGRKRRN